MGKYVECKEIIEVDLREKESSRWDNIIYSTNGDSLCALKLAEQAELDLKEAIPGWTYKIFTKGFSFLYKRYNGMYFDEIKSWANGLGKSVGEMVALNSTYELSHLNPSMIYGCTAAVKHVPGMGMVHVRSMDWPLSEIGNATRVFKFIGPLHDFYAVGTPGYVGVLSGMVPGGYSVTINWAPPQENPSFDMGPSFLLRKVLEECTTYEQAVYALSRTPIATPVFYTVCGVNEGEACVIERGKNEYGIREIGNNGVISQANHHVLDEFEENNKDMHLIDPDMDPVCLYDDSVERMATLGKSLIKVKSRNFEDYGQALDVEPVLNDDAYQQMIFCPKTGKIKVWRYES